MAERKSLSKKLRFEVFKRDGFTCQYCGQMSPDVVLEVDHIVPVAEGGKNDLLNLIAACVDCNRGKGAREISDNSIVKMQQKQLAELNERKEQMKMMLAWKEELALLLEGQTDALDAMFVDRYGYPFKTFDRQKVKGVIRRFGFNEAYDAVEIALQQYDRLWEAVDKLGGICYNRKHGKAGKQNG